MNSTSEHGFVSEFVEKAKSKPDEVFASFDGSEITFRRLLTDSGSIASEIRRRGLSKGDRVAVMMRNSQHSVSILYGIARASAVWIPINAQQKGEGLRYILEHSKPSLIIADSDFLEVISESGATINQDNIIVLRDEDDARSLDAIIATRSEFEDNAPAGRDLFAIMYTSGTTGRPKGVMVTNAMLRYAGEAVQTLTDMKNGDVFFVWEPFFHIGGAQLITLPVIADVQLAMVDRFSASRFWDQVRETKASHIHYLGGILQILLKQPESPRDREHPVRMAWGGGCPKDVWPLFRDRFGVEIRECYGMTEASSITTSNTEGVVGSVGKPMPWFDISVEDERGNVLPTGERGEIVVRSSSEGALFAGYLDNPEATSMALKDGALHTGDAGTLDADGFLWFHGRMTDSVRCKGENVSAFEVEHVAAAHPDVEDCAMIGVATDVGEQDIKLFVKAKAGRTINAAELSRYLGDRLAVYQNPRYISVVDEFERTPSQRIMKHVLSKDTKDGWDRLAK